MFQGFAIFSIVRTHVVHVHLHVNFFFLLNLHTSVNKKSQNGVSAVTPHTLENV